MSTDKKYTLVQGMALEVGMALLRKSGEEAIITELRPGSDPLHTVVWLQGNGELRKMIVRNLGQYRVTNMLEREAYDYVNERWK